MADPPPAEWKARRAADGTFATVARTFGMWPALMEKLHPTLNGVSGKELASLPALYERKYWWKCPEGDDHVWQQKLKNVLRAQVPCPYCRGAKVSKTNCLETVIPEMAAQWHPTKNGSLTPRDVVFRSLKKVWWKCDVADDHEWYISPGQRQRKGAIMTSGCPMCSGHQLSITNCLATVNPELAKQWHPTKNGDLTPRDIVAGTHTKYWWKCDKADDHVWLAAPHARHWQSQGCPCCAGRQLAESNCLATVAPKVANEWHPTKNGSLTPRDVIANTNHRFWFLCPKCGNEWLAWLHGRVSGARGECPSCNPRFRGPRYAEVGNWKSRKGTIPSVEVQAQRRWDPTSAD